MDFQKRVLLSAAGADFIRNGESGKKLGEYCRTILRWRLPFSGFKQHVLARFVGPKARNRVSILNLWERKRTILGLREAAAKNGAPFG